jgi:hypothetical protein
MKQTQGEIATRANNMMSVSTIMVANNLGHIMSKVTGKDCKAHDIEENSFELSIDGRKYDGGSYYIDEAGMVILASVTPQKVLGHFNNQKELERNLSF